LQRSSNKGDVKDRRRDKPRNNVQRITAGLEGKPLTGNGSIKDLFAVLWAQQMIVEKYHLMNSNFQSFVTFVSKQMTQEKYEFQEFFNCPTPPENDRKTEMLDLINILTVTVESWHPLFTLIYLENTDMFDTITKGGEYDMGITHYGVTLLNFAIVFSKTEMVKHLLNPPYSADPTEVDDRGRNALQMAAVFTEQLEIIDSLLAHSKVKIDDVDDKQHGMTALHCAAMASNEITADHLIKKGANVNHPNNDGATPLHVSALFAENMKIIDVLLKNIRREEIGQYKKDARLLPYGYCNKHGLEGEIVERLVEKGMVSNEQVQNPQVLKALNAVKQKVAQNPATSTGSAEQWPI
jgi:hypothetical protein